MHIAYSHLHLSLSLAFFHSLQVLLICALLRSARAIGHGEDVVDIHLHWTGKKPSVRKIMKIKSQFSRANTNAIALSFMVSFFLHSVFSLASFLFMHEIVSNQQCPLVLVRVHHLTQKLHNFPL